MRLCEPTPTDPREFMAYQVSHATAEEAKQLSALGFQILAQ